MKFSVIITFALISLTAAQNNFRAQNADDAEKLTEDFKKLTPDSPCKDGDQACVKDQFAQCVGGKFALNSCGGGDLKCVVLPLVNKRGTSITCSTEQDRLNRLADARGQAPPNQSEQPPKGKDKNNVETPDPNQPQSPNEQPPKGKGKDNVETPDPNQPPKEQQPPKENEQPTPPESGKGKDNTKQPENFRAQNADDAEKLTEDFKKLTPDSPCKDGDQACVKDQFAQCVGGKFALNSCGGGDLKCVVLPLVNKRGTSITCSTEQDRLNRLADARGQTPPNQSEQPPKGKGKDNVETPDPNQPPKEQQPPKGNEQPPNQSDQPQQPQQPPKENPKGKGSLAEIRSKNADEAEKLQEQFKSFTPDQACKDNEIACVNDELAQCVNNKFSLTKCGGGLKCSVLPLVLKEGTTVACTTEADRIARLDEARKNS